MLAGMLAWGSVGAEPSSQTSHAAGLLALQQGALGGKAQHRSSVIPMALVRFSRAALVVCASASGAGTTGVYAAEL